jgi:hypothetical protein
MIPPAIICDVIHILHLFRYIFNRTNNRPLTIGEQAEIRKPPTLSSRELSHLKQLVFLAYQELDIRHDVVSGGGG